MRLIEKKMVEALKEGRSFKSGNTKVSAPSIQFLGAVGPVEERSVYLFGNKIATISSDQEGFRMLTICMCGWPSVTTRSRLNAIANSFAGNFAGVYQKRGSQLLQGSNREIDSGASHTFSLEGA